MKIIQRHANDDYEALVIAQAMEDAGATVFSVSSNGQHQRYGALAPSTKYIVWAKFDDPVSYELIDEKIDKAMTT